MSAKKKTEIRDTFENRDRIHLVMVFLTWAFIALTVGILICIGRIQATYTVDESVINLFRPRPDKYTETPKRGRILAQDGRPLAITTPLYDIYMDCTVRKSEFEEIDLKEQRRHERLAKEGKDCILITGPLFLTELLDRFRVQNYVIQRSGIFKVQPLEKFVISEKEAHCGGCGHNCFLSNPGCGVGREKAQRRKQRG